MALYSQLIAACWLALAAWAARTGCAGLAAARVAPATNNVAGIATSRTTFISTLRNEPGHRLGLIPAPRCAELPGAERNTGPAARIRPSLVLLHLIDADCE